LNDAARGAAFQKENYMRKSVMTAAVAALFLSAAAFAASGIKDGNLIIKPAKHDRFATSAYVLGKAELFGYIGELKDSEHITGIVLRDASRATPEQKHLLAVTAQAQQIKAYVEGDDGLEPLVDPTPAKAAPAVSAAQ
jgi:hypothetical protein